MQMTATQIKLRRRLDGECCRKLAKNFITRIRSDDAGRPGLYGRKMVTAPRKLMRFWLISGNDYFLSYSSEMSRFMEAGRTAALLLRSTRANPDPVYP